MNNLDKKRENILDAAMQCLARYGMVKSTLDDIARLVGLNKASLYYYYKNKEAIFMDALEREALRFFDRVDKKIVSLPTSAEKITALVRTFHEYFRQRAEVFEMTAQAMVDNHTLLQTMHKRMRSRNVDYMAVLIQEGIDRGEFENHNAKQVADVIRTIVDSRHLEIYRMATERPDARIDFKKLENESLFILDIFLNGLVKKKRKT
jgi:AcrR family transcriptional regulator